ncbi:sulfotransferase [Leisingera sp. ANG59]|uniref:sulfotransferase n=1 Tax=Leisingera sp. ANG59 TaxID=2675221 RepID=UPI001572CE28
MTIKVVLIAGAGRSGSTFLSQLLSQNEDCQNVGQIRHLPMSMHKNWPCSCGQTLPLCGYWGQIAARMVQTHGASAMEELRDGFAAFQKTSNQINNWSDAKARNDIRAAHPRFLELLVSLYRFASAEAQNRVLIDSSKLPNLALALQLAEGIDLYILNLVRDPRAVAVSWSKLVKKTEVLRQRARNWNKRVKRMQELEQVADDAFLQLKYEDFANTPRPVLEQIQAWAGLTQDTSFFIASQSAEISWERTHLFPPANEEVLQKQATRIDIRPASSWKSEAHTEVRKMAEEINFPKAAKLGYRKAL